MESTGSVLKQPELEEKTMAVSQAVQNPASPAKLDDAPKLLQKLTPPQHTPPKLVLIPLKPAAALKDSNHHQQQKQQKPLETKQFPIVLGRTNLSQWWYQSCDCQQYYCRLHCRPVAQNIGSLSKVMIQIDTKGTAHIVGKNPHLVSIITPERGNNNNVNNGNNDAKDNGGSSNKDDKKKTEKKDENLNKEEDQNKDDNQQPILLRALDILSIGRRDQEPWMRFQIVERTAAANAAPTSAKANANDIAAKNVRTKIIDGIAKEAKGAGDIAKKEASVEASRQKQPTQNVNNGKTKAQPGAVANAASSIQQQNAHHDAQLPEWITTTTTTNTATGKRSRSSSSYHNYDITDTKQQQQQHHQAMVATLTKAAAAAGAAADADERNKSKKHYRYNSYYNYYNQSNYEADSNTAQRKRRRYTTSSFAPYNHGVSSHNNKAQIRSAEDLFHNGSSRRGGRLQGHHNDPQIHLVFQDYETSARLIEAGTRQGRNEMKIAKETDINGEYKNSKDGGNNNNINKNDEPQHSTNTQRRHARTNRNFIGKPIEERTINATTNTFATVCNSNGVCDGDEMQKQQSKSMGLLSKNYAAALLEVSTPSMVASAEVGETVMDNMPPPVMLQGDQDFESQHNQ